MSSIQGPHDLDALWEYADPVASEQRFRDALGEDLTPDLRLEAQTQLARSLALRRRFAEADAELDALEARLGAASRPRIRWLLEKSRIQNDLGNDGKAIDLSTQAWELAESVHELGLALDAAHMLGVIGDPADAVEWNRKAIAIALASPEEAARRWLGTLYSNQGHHHLRLSRWREARECFEQSLRFREGRGQDEKVRDAKVDLGKVLRGEGRHEEALAWQRALWAECEAAGDENGYVCEELGELLRETDPGEARVWFARAYRALVKDPWFPPREAARLERIRKLGEG